MLVVDGQHVRQLVEDLTDGIPADPAEGFVGLDDVAGRVGDQDGRGGMLEYRGGHAQVFFRTALLADVTAYTEHALEGTVLIPNQYQAQFDRNLVAIGAQAIKDEQLRWHLLAQQGQLLAIAQRRADTRDQGVDAGQLRGVGKGVLPAIGEHPAWLIAQYCLHRRADIIELQGVVGGENHIADALGEHAVALFAVAQ
ncbi:hypothetical protein D9M73_207320 [compost metagenome]